DPTLCKVLTGDYHRDRVLGATREVIVPIRCLWLGTGNNVALGSDMPRRIAPINLDAQSERPWLRAKLGEVTFKHPHLLEWVRKQRPALVAAACTLVRAWIAAGRPAGKVTHGMYESWARIVGGILEVAGQKGFLGNLDELYETADVEADQGRAFAATWW